MSHGLGDVGKQNADTRGDIFSLRRYSTRVRDKNRVTRRGGNMGGLHWSRAVILYLPAPGFEGREGGLHSEARLDLDSLLAIPLGK